MRMFFIKTLVRLFEFTKIYTDDFPTVREYLKKNKHFVTTCLFIHLKKQYYLNTINTKLDRIMIEEFDSKVKKNKRR
jgi:hypothetical protein